MHQHSHTDKLLRRVKGLWSGQEDLHRAGVQNADEVISTIDTVTGKILQVRQVWPELAEALDNLSWVD